MALLEGGAGLVQLVHHLQQIRHAFSGAIVQSVSLLFMVDDQTSA